jgi:lipopolysaccharide transport system ATP-binding protein
MSDSVITVENLGKKYLIGHQQSKGRVTLSENIVSATKSLFGFSKNPDSKSQSKTEEFWALKDVSFEVKQGEVLGIIGRNGAGKSTLLKILSRITKPTTGEVCIRGRVASLLEVGTGFHPELTGRENVFLNGAILGMSQQEIRQKFDEIVDFAEIDQFIDTPVKHYSSGMYVRLAFAVASHLDREILILDEVLSVGDLAFQKKCLDWLEKDNKERQVTSLVVSHSIAAIKSMCERAIFIQKGELVEQGSASDVCNTYIKSMNEGMSSLVTKPRLYKSEEATIYDCWIEAGAGKATLVHLPEVIEIHGLVDVHQKCITSFEVVIKDKKHKPFALAQHGLNKSIPNTLEIGRYKFVMKLPSIDFAEGNYYFDISIGEPNRRFYDLVEDALSLEIFNSLDSLTSWKYSQATNQGCILINSDVTIT